MSLMKSPRMWILTLFIVLSFIAIHPQFDTDGVMVRQVLKESPAALAGMQSPLADDSLVSRERILEVNGDPVADVESFHSLVAQYPAGSSIVLITDRQRYEVQLPENASPDLGITVGPSPRSNLRLGLDLAGGTRVVLQPESQVSDADLDLIMENIKQRLNVYGLADVIVRDARDLSGDSFIIVEIAGVSKDEVRDLLANQGKFVATISNQTVFRGGSDITSVCRTAECSGIDRQQGCGAAGDGTTVCRFSFSISLTPEAAERQADLTRDLAVVSDGGNPYLNETLQLYLDDALVDELQIGADLKGEASTEIMISGSGAGATVQAAEEDAIANMKRLQTILITGSLPVKLEVVKSDGISPAVGAQFVRNAVIVGLLSTLAVSLILVMRYRKPIISIPIIITMFAEIIIILGFAAITGWNLDLVAIAAIVIAIGSGVNDQIVLIDETLQGGTDRGGSWKDRVKSAFFIIFAAYFTIASAMIPLYFAGAGLLRGFAVTTLVGVTAGVLITRPAFAHFIEALLKKDGE